MALHRARWILVVSSLLTLVDCSLVSAQQQSAPGRVRLKSDTAPPTGNRTPVKPASQEEAPAKGRPQRETRTPRPEPQELRIEPLEPELEKLLKEWEVESSKIKTLSGEHQRIVYNKVFEVEKWGEGQFFYESPDKGRIDMEGREPPKGRKSKRISPTSGDPFRIEADAQTKWVCTGIAVLNINDKEKQYEMFELPKEMQGKNIIHGPLPFLFGMKAEDAKRRFELSFDFDEDKQNTEEYVWIKAVPRQVMDRDNFKVATIQLDRKRFLPLAVKLVDPSENVETVYIFPKDKLHVNKRSLIPKIFSDKPFEPRLAGYTRIMSDVQLAEEDRVLPAGNKVPAPQKPQKKTADPRAPGDSKKPRK